MRRFASILSVLLLLTLPALAQSTIEGLSPVPTFPLPDPGITASDLWITQGCVTPPACDYKIPPTKLGYIFQGTIAPLSPFQNQMWWDTNTTPPILKVFQASSWVPFPNVSGFAPLNSPAFTGVPTAPTGTTGDTSTQIATDAFVAASQRIRLTQNTTMYISTTGSDASNNTCLVSGTPCATVQYAFNRLRDLYDLAGFTVTIQLADGSYSQGFFIREQLLGQIGPEQLVVQGNPGNPLSVSLIGVATPPTVLNSANIYVQYSGLLTVAFMHLQSSSVEILVTRHGFVQYHDMDFGTSVGDHISANEQGVAKNLGNNSISGGGSTHFAATVGGLNTGGGTLFSSTLTLSGTPAFSSGFALAGDTGVITAFNITFVGPATGVRYALATNGVIETGGAGSTYFPGNAAGTVATGGVYN